MKAPRKFKRLIPNIQKSGFDRMSNSRQVNKQFYQSRQWRSVREASKQITLQSQLSDADNQHYYAQKVLLQGSPLCVKCLKKKIYTKANTCDHIKPISLGGNESDLNNLQWLCSRCHNKKSASETHKGNK